MGRDRAMMNHAVFTMAKRQQLWCKAAQTTTLLDNILVQHSAKSPPFTQCFGVDAKYARHLRVFEEMCVVADTDNKVRQTNRSMPLWTLLAVLWQMCHVWITSLNVTGYVLVTGRQSYLKQNSTIFHVLGVFIAVLLCLEHHLDV